MTSIESTSHKLLHVYRLFRRMLKVLKLMFVLTECCTVSGVGMRYYQPQQVLPRAMIPVSLGWDGFRCQ